MLFFALITLAGPLVILIALIAPKLFGNSRKRGSLIGLGMTVGGFIGVAANVDASDRPDRDAAQRAAVAAGSIQTDRVAQPASPPSPPTSPTLPNDQRALMEAVSTFRLNFNAAPNDMARGAQRPARAEAICRAVPRLAVHNWVGTVSELSSNNEGRGVLAIALDRNTTVGTWSNSLSDMTHNTLIPSNSEVFRSAVALSRGQSVIFSGQFFRDQTDCLSEASLTVRGGMTSPRFVFRFSEVRSTQ